MNEVKMMDMIRYTMFYSLVDCTVPKEELTLGHIESAQEILEGCK